MEFNLDAFLATEKDTKTRTKFEFEQLLKDLKVPVRTTSLYTSYKICSYLYVRCYQAHYQVHINGDFDYHSVKRQEYVEFRNLKNNPLLSILQDV